MSRDTTASDGVRTDEPGGIGNTVQVAGGADLRRLLAEGVARRREEETDIAPRPGVFDDLKDRPTIRFATTGRRSGLRREKWWLPFVVDGDSIYLIEESPQEADWLKNARAHPAVEVGADGLPWRPATARCVTDDAEAQRARRLMKPKFGGGEWAFINQGAVIAFDAVGPPPAGPEPRTGPGPAAVADPG